MTTIIYYKANKYDITNFINKHPGGSHVFSNSNDQDITCLVQISHFNIDKVEQVLNKYKILDTNIKYGIDFTLYNKLKKEVQIYLPSTNTKSTKYSILSFIILLFNIILHIYLWIKFITKPTIIYTVFLAINSICYFGKVHHEANHNAISYNPYINYLLRYTLLPFASPSMWNHDHNIRHHQFTNTILDIDSNPESILYYNSRKPTHWYYKYQYIYFTFLSLLVVFSKGIYYSIINMNINNDNIYHIISFLLCYVYPTIKHRTILPTILFTLYSSIFTIISQVNHIQEHTLNFKQTNDFCINQINTTVNYKTNWLTQYLCFGLNYQIEHHLFPTIAHEHYDIIRPLIQSFCLEHNIKYTIYDSLYESCVQYYKYLYNIMNNKNI